LSARKAVKSILKGALAASLLLSLIWTAVYWKSINVLLFAPEEHYIIVYSSNLYGALEPGG